MCVAGVGSHEAHRAFLCQAPGYLHADRHEGLSLPTTTRWPGVWEEKKGEFVLAGLRRQPCAPPGQAPASREPASEVTARRRESLCPGQNILNETRPGTEVSERPACPRVKRQHDPRLGHGGRGAPLVSKRPATPVGKTLNCPL